VKFLNAVYVKIDNILLENMGNSMSGTKISFNIYTTYDNNK